MFKEYIKKDIDVFLNNDEFAQKVQINGKEVRILLDNDRMTQKAIKDIDGTSFGDILFFISKEDFESIPHMGKTPKTGSALSFSGKPCVISEVCENADVYEITLEA